MLTAFIPVVDAQATGFTPAVLRADDASERIEIQGTSLDADTQDLQLEVGSCTGAGMTLKLISQSLP